MARITTDGCPGHARQDVGPQVSTRCPLHSSPSP